MPEPFKGRIEPDGRHSVPNRAPFTLRKALDAPPSVRIPGVGIDVCDEQYLDLEREAAAALSRE